MKQIRSRRFAWILSGFAARFAFAFAALQQVRRARRLFPQVQVRFHFIQDEWGMSRPLCLTEMFELPISSLQLEHKWQTREIEAFQSGEEAMKAYFADLRNVYPDRGQEYEIQRRERTPVLMKADPQDFVILIQISKDEEIQIRDGAHRAVIAQKSGQQTINAKLIGPYTPSFGWEWFLIPYYTTLRRFWIARSLGRAAQP